MDLEKDFAPAFLNLGLAYHSQKEYDKAIAALQKGLELDDRLQSAALFLGIDYFEVGLPEKAINPLEKSLALSPEDPDAHEWLGKSLLAVGRYQQGLPHLEKALKANPNSLEVIYSLGRAHLLLSRQIFDELYKKGPQSYWVHFLLGRSFQAGCSARPAFAVTSTKRRPPLPSGSLWYSTLDLP